MLLRASCGELIYDMTMEDASRLGILQVPDIRMVLYSSPEITGVHSDDWTDLYYLGVVRNAARNNAIVRIVQSNMDKGIPTLVLIRRLEHGNLLLQQIGFGMPSGDVVYLQGGTSAFTRDRSVSLFESGRVKCVIASSIFDEGKDIPSIGSVVIAAAGKSSIKNIQRVGRGMRKSEGKTSLTIYDFVDEGHKVLRAHTRSRERDYMQQNVGTVSRVEVEDVLRETPRP
jgi:superfamily II DNA or RNA helicase